MLWIVYISDLSPDSRKEMGCLALQNTSGILIVQQNDNPYGVFSFPSQSREKSIAEDIIGNN